MTNDVVENAMQPAGRNSGRSERRIQSVEVGFRIVRVLEGASGKLALKDIAAAADLSASSAYLYLSSFINVGLAVQDPVSGRYGLGPYAIQLGLAGLRQLDVLDVARDPLEALAAETGLSVFLSVWNNLGPTILLKADGTRSMPLTLRIGSVLPPLESATGRICVAHLPRAEVRAVMTRLGKDVSEADVAAVVHDVERCGYSLSDSRYSEDFAAMAVPIFGYSGEIAAALTLLGSKTRIRTGDLYPRLAATAASIGAALGHAATAAPKIAAGSKSAAAILNPS